jgi:DNA-binding XRE family transcriptional regulator
MDKGKIRAIEAAGFRVGDAEDFLELTEGERKVVELRVRIAQLIRRKRKGSHITQEDLALRIGSTQGRVALIESGGRGVSLDQSFRALFAVNGTIDELVRPAPAKATNRVFAAGRPGPAAPKAAPVARKMSGKTSGKKAPKAVGK